MDGKDLNRAWGRKEELEKNIEELESELESSKESLSSVLELIERLEGD